MSLPSCFSYISCYYDDDRESMLYYDNPYLMRLFWTVRIWVLWAHILLSYLLYLQLYWYFGQSLDSWMPATCNRIWVCPSAPIVMRPLWWWLGRHAVSKKVHIYICYTHAGLLEFQHSVWFLSPHSFSIYYTCVSCSNLSTIWILERLKHVNVHVCLSAPAIIKPWWWPGGHVDNAYILRSSWFVEIWAVCAFLEPSLFWC